MMERTEILQENPAPVRHTLSLRGGGAMKEGTPQEKVEVRGKCGIITVQHSTPVPDEINEDFYEDINTLLARILIMKQKRLAAGE